MPLVVLLLSFLVLVLLGRGIFAAEVLVIPRATLAGAGEATACRWEASHWDVAYGEARAVLINC